VKQDVFLIVRVEVDVGDMDEDAVLAHLTECADVEVTFESTERDVTVHEIEVVSVLDEKPE
jgi:hypothetical protein